MGIIFKVGYCNVLILQYIATNTFKKIRGGEVQPIVILLTDGKNNAGYKNPETAAAELKKKYKAQIVVIGVGNKYEKSELMNIATDPSYVFETATFDGLAKILDDVVSMACEGIFPCSIKLDKLNLRKKIFDTTFCTLVKM